VGCSRSCQLASPGDRMLDVEDGWGGHGPYRGARNGCEGHRQPCTLGSEQGRMGTAERRSPQKGTVTIGRGAKLRYASARGSQRFEAVSRSVLDGTLLRA